jgi:hypothetical protein
VAPQEYLRSNKIYVGLFLIRQKLSGGVRLLREPTLVYSMCQGDRRDEKKHRAWSMGHRERQLAAGRLQRAADRKTLGTRHFFLAASGK